MKKRKMKKSVKRLILIIIIVIVFGLGIFYIIDNFTARTPVNTKVKVIDEIAEYGYKLLRKKQLQTLVTKTLLKIHLRSY